MIQRLWVHEKRKLLVCVDSYEQGVLRGRIHAPLLETEAFQSLSEFFVRIESLLNEAQAPQSYTIIRSFSPALHLNSRHPAPEKIQRGKKATFELQILFRQHSSWQGRIIWREKKQEHCFRSALELVLLIDNALRSMEGCDAV